MGDCETIHKQGLYGLVKSLAQCSILVQTFQAGFIACQVLEIGELEMADTRTQNKNFSASVDFQGKRLNLEVIPSDKKLAAIEKADGKESDSWAKAHAVQIRTQAMQNNVRRLVSAPNSVYFKEAFNDCVAGTLGDICKVFGTTVKELQAGGSFSVIRHSATNPEVMVESWDFTWEDIVKLNDANTALGYIKHTTESRAITRKDIVIELDQELSLIEIS